MDVTTYTQALVSYAEQIDDTEPLEKERDALFTRLTNGEDEKTLVNSNINGKSYGWDVNGLTLGQKFQAFVNAIKTLKNVAGDSPFTFIDFSQLGGKSSYPYPPLPWC